MPEWRSQAYILAEKAAGDDWSARELAARAAAPAWVIGFHAQQAVEKYLKAVLAYRDITFPRSHDIEELVGLLRRKGVPLPPHADELPALTPFGVAFRYDDQGIADPSERLELIAAIAIWLTATRQWTESFIGPITTPTSDSAE